MTAEADDLDIELQAAKLRIAALERFIAAQRTGSPPRRDVLRDLEATKHLATRHWSRSNER